MSFRHNMASMVMRMIMAMNMIILVMLLPFVTINSGVLFELFDASGMEFPGIATCSLLAGMWH